MNYDLIIMAIMMKMMVLVKQVLKLQFMDGYTARMTTDGPFNFGLNAIMIMEELEKI